MKYHPLFKGLAVLLATLAVLVALASFTGITLVVDNNLYHMDIEDWMQTQAESNGHALAWPMLQRYTALKLGGCDSEVLHYAGIPESKEELSTWHSVDPKNWDYTIQDAGGNYLEGTFASNLSTSEVFTYTFHSTCDYPVDVTVDELATFDDTNSTYRDYFYTETEEHYLYYFPSPEYTVTVRMAPIVAYRTIGMTKLEATWLYEHRNLFIISLAVCIVFFALCLAYLCFAAGKVWKTGETVTKGLNRLPLDLYLAATVLSVLGGGYVFISAVEQWSFTHYLPREFLVITCLAVFAAAIVAIFFLYAMAAQIKAKNHYWWKNSVLGRLCKPIIWSIRFLFHGIRKLFYMLPLIWQWILIAVAMVIVPLLFLAGLNSRFYEISLFFCLISCLVDLAIVCYGAYAFGVLLKGAKDLSSGNLHAKISTRYLFGHFRDFGDQLNSLADAAVVAAKNQMKSDRMKTELITNVSHDIKTPLTSLINYVDLLQKPHSQEEGKQYLEVLGRQSQQLKKLIDDLMDMSKATTGNMHVEVTPLDATEAINQALGEFSDKLDACGLTTVFRQPETPVIVLADGRLTWRVLSNLFGNIVKYTLPGTRVYVDLTQQNGWAQLSLKNISREALNVSADELIERFVRGDTSRNTEGSGLGLNIAKSLMELQGGQLELLVDGDLFKVTLTFPMP